MDRLKVLMFGWEYAPIVSGGLGVVCRSLSQQLVKKGAEVTFVLPKFPQSVEVDNLRLIDASEEEVDKEFIKHVEVRTMLSPYLTENDFRRMHSMWSKRESMNFDAEIYGWNLFDEVIKYAGRAYAIARNNPHDVIHAHDWMTFKAAINAKKVSSKPLIVHIHATELERTAGNPNPLIVEYEKEGMDFADKVIAVSEKTKDRIVQNYGIAADKIEVVHNAVDQENAGAAHEIDPKRDHKTVLFLARMAASKGADYLLQAAARVLSRMEDVRFVFVGKGSMLEELINMSIDLGISQNVVFTGFLNHEEVDRAYRQADLFVMPSVAEPFGITALEAIRNGTPVLMSKQSGASEVVRNALKVDFWDVDEMANKILAVLSHDSLANTLSDHGFHDLQRVTWDTQAGRVLELYSALAY